MHFTFHAQMQFYVQMRILRVLDENILSLYEMQKSDIITIAHLSVDKRCTRLRYPKNAYVLLVCIFIVSWILGWGLYTLQREIYKRWTKLILKHWKILTRMEILTYIKSDSDEYISKFTSTGYYSCIYINTFWKILFIPFFLFFFNLLVSWNKVKSKHFYPLAVKDEYIYFLIFPSYLR